MSQVGPPNWRPNRALTLDRTKAKRAIRVLHCVESPDSEDVVEFPPRLREGTADQVLKELSENSTIVLLMLESHELAKSTDH